MSDRPAADLLIRLEPGSRDGLQQQIYAGIRLAILDGVLAPGARLPSSRTLARDLSVSRTTSLLALEQLLAEGYLTARRGSGTFVAHELPDVRPLASLVRRGAGSRHPPLSQRGAALAATPAFARRVPGPPRAFRIGTPALDLFPVELWSQLAGRRRRSLTTAQLDYSDATGFAGLRAAIAEHVRAARGTQCDADQVVLTGGAQHALDIAARLLLDPGDEAWMEDPGYPGAYGALVGAGARIVPVPVDADGLDVEAGRRLAPHARLAYVTPSHQFPLGVPMSQERRQSLLEWARDAEAWLLEDDYDSEYRYGARPSTCLHGLDPDGRVLYVGSFAKTLFPALRLGFLIVPGELRETLRAVRRATGLHPPIEDQLVLADFIQDGHFDRHLRRMRAAYAQRLEALLEAAQRHCAGALRVRPTRTGLHAVADVPGVDATRVAEQALARGVECMPVSAYAFGQGRPPNALVLGFGSARPDAIERAMPLLGEAIEAARRAQVAAWPRTELDLSGELLACHPAESLVKGGRGK